MEERLTVSKVINRLGDGSKTYDVVIRQITAHGGDEVTLSPATERDAELLLLSLERDGGAIRTDDFHRQH